jgi:hypothetical protein
MSERTLILMCSIFLVVRCSSWDAVAGRWFCWRNWSTGATGPPGPVVRKDVRPLPLRGAGVRRQQYAPLNSTTEPDRGDRRCQSRGHPSASARPLVTTYPSVTFTFRPSARGHEHHLNINLGTPTTILPGYRSCCEMVPRLHRFKQVVRFHVVPGASGSSPFRTAVVNDRGRSLQGPAPTGCAPHHTFRTSPSVSDGYVDNVPCGWESSFRQGVQALSIRPCSTSSRPTRTITRSPTEGRLRTNSWMS